MSASVCRWKTNQSQLYNISSDDVTLLFKMHFCAEAEIWTAEAERRAQRRRSCPSTPPSYTPVTLTAREVWDRASILIRLWSVCVELDSDTQPVALKAPESEIKESSTHLYTFHTSLYSEVMWTWLHSTSCNRHNNPYSSSESITSLIYGHNTVCVQETVSPQLVWLLLDSSVVICSSTVHKPCTWPQLLSFLHLQRRQ